MKISLARTFIAMAAFGLPVAVLSSAAGVAAQEAVANAIELKNLESGKESLSQDKGYIYIRSTQYRSQGVFLKTPDAEDIAEFEAEWREKFDKAAAKYPRRLESWKERKASRRGTNEERPVEPTEESFSIGSIETRMLVSFGPQYIFDKGKDASGEKYFDYVIEVDPGEYTYYGPLFMGPNGPVGVCYCMGSVKFSVEAGTIASLGDFLLGKWVSREALAQATIFADEMPDRSGSPVDYTVPQSLSALPSAPAELFAAGKMNNFFRAGVQRLPPVEGVLAYDRDTVIDVKAEMAAKAEEEARVAAEAEAEAEAARQAEAASAAAPADGAEDAASAADDSTGD